MDIFWNTIAGYNSATWLFQLIIVIIGIILTSLLLRRSESWVKLSMKFYLIFLYIWIAVVYYYIYCAERSYNVVMALFWGVMAVIWIWDTLIGYTTLERSRKYDGLAYILLAMPFIYPFTFFGTRTNIPGYYLSGDALFGSGIYYRVTIAVCS